MARISVAFALVTCVAAGLAVASSRSSSESRWIPIDLLRLARHRYPAFVDVQPIGFVPTGDVLWTARELDADGGLRHVFALRDRRLRDLGSLGQPDDVPVAVNEHEQIAVARFTVPTGIAAQANPPPPPRALLWQHGRLTDLGTLGGNAAFAVAINDRGEVVGWSTLSSAGRTPGTHAFLWRGGKMTDLGTLGGRWSEPTGINDQEEIVGSSGTPDGGSHAFLWRAGHMIDLGTLGGLDSEALAVNERGQVLGLSATERVKEMNRPFLWQNGKLTDLGISIDPDRLTTTINNNGLVIGTAGTLEGPRGFVWRQGKVTALGTVDAHATEPTAVNDMGQVVGGTAGPGLRSHVFLWQSGSLTKLPSPRLALPPRVWIARDGRHILAVSDALGGLRRRILLWTRSS